MSQSISNNSGVRKETLAVLKRKAELERQRKAAEMKALIRIQSLKEETPMPYESLSCDLFNPPVKVEQENSAAAEIKNVLGEHESLGDIIRGTALTIRKRRGSQPGTSQQALEPEPSLF